jgi:hypothetical protein
MRSAGIISKEAEARREKGMYLGTSVYAVYEYFLQIAPDFCAYIETVPYLK